MNRIHSFAIISIILCIALLFSACQPGSQTPVVDQTEPPAQETTAAETAKPTEPFASEAVATETASVNAETDQPTAPAVPTETQQPTQPPTPQPAVISGDAIRNLAFTSRLGSGAVVTVALSPDASQVTVLTTTALLTYDVARGDLLWQMDTGRVFNRGAYSSDGSQIITSTRGGAVQRWDAKTGQQAGDPLPVIENTRAVALSGNGALLAALDIFDVTNVWDTATGAQVQTNNGLAYPFGAMQVAISPDGKTFLNSGIDSKNNYQIRVWDVERGRFLVNLQGLPGEVYDLDFSPDGLYAAAVSTRVSGGLRGMQYLYLWRVSDGALLDTVDLNLDATVYGFIPAVVNPDLPTPAPNTPVNTTTTVLAGNARGQIMLINFRISDQFAYGFIQDQFPAHAGPVVGFSTSADSLKYASIGADGSVKVWDVQTGEALFTAQVEGLSLTNTHDEWVYRDLEVTNVQHESGFSASPSANMVARTAADLHSIEIVDLSTGEILNTLQIETQAYISSPVFSPDGKNVAAVLDGSRIVVWDAQTGAEQIRLATQHLKPITKLLYAPDGSQLASMSNGELFVWDLQTVRQKHALTTFRSFDWSADGNFLITDVKEMGINLLDGATGRKIVYIETGFINDIAISPDSQFAAAVGYRSLARYQQDNLVYFIDIAQQKRINTLEISGYPAEVVAAAYTPDGAGLVTIDAYGDVYIWNPNTGALLAHFAEQVPLPTLVPLQARIDFSSDGRSLLIMGSDGSIQIFQTAG